VTVYVHLTLSVVLLTTVLLNVVFLCAIMLNVIYLNAVILSVIMLNVVAPFTGVSGNATKVDQSMARNLVRE